MAASLGQLLRSALSPSSEERRWAGDALQASAAQPGYCSALLLASQPGGASDEERLLAATLLKNEVLRRWRKGARGIPESERPALRAALVARLGAPESSERVGAQLALAVARVMRAEANAGEAAVLEAFATALGSRGELPPHALLALCYTAKELGSMRLPAQRRLAARVRRA